MDFPPATAPRSSASTQERQAAQQTSAAHRGRSRPSAILLLLQAAFGSWRLALLVLPDPADGPGGRGIGRLPRRRGPVSLGSLVGFFTVLGIAARNGILLINHFQHLERDEGDAVRPGAGAAWRSGTAVTDPDDHAGHRSRPGPAGGVGDRPATRSSTRWRW